MLALWDGKSVELGSRGAKPLTRYFPELVEALARLLPRPCLIDGEIVVASGPVGGQRSAPLSVRRAAGSSAGA